MTDLYHLSSYLIINSFFVFLSKKYQKWTIKYIVQEPFTYTNQD